MNKNANEKVVISTRRFKKNTPNSNYNEPAIELYWDEYACGVSLLLNSRKVSVFSYDQNMQAALIMAWNNANMNMIIRNAYNIEGEKGFITLINFYMKRSRQI